MENIQTIESIADNLALILSLGDVTVITGAAGVGKTYLARTLSAAWGDRAPAIVELDGSTPENLESLMTNSGVPAILVGQEAPIGIAVDAVVTLAKDGNGDVDVLVTRYAGSFKLN